MISILHVDSSLSLSVSRRLLRIRRMAIRITLDSLKRTSKELQPLCNAPKLPAQILNRAKAVWISCEDIFALRGCVDGSRGRKSICLKSPSFSGNCWCSGSTLVIVGKFRSIKISLSADSATWCCRSPWNAATQDRLAAAISPKSSPSSIFAVDSETGFKLRKTSCCFSLGCRIG